MKAFSPISTRQKDKFNCLAPSNPQKKGLDVYQVVINLSSKKLDPLAVSALVKGLSFAPTPLEVPVKEFVSSIEQTAGTRSERQAEIVRVATSHILLNIKIPWNNLSMGQRAALSPLGLNQQLVILSADEGKAVVILDISVYGDKMATLLNDPTYM